MFYLSDATLSVNLKSALFNFVANSREKQKQKQKQHETKGKELCKRIEILKLR